MNKRYSSLLLLLTLLGLFGSMDAMAQTTPFASTFDHYTTGWPLEGSHRNVDCGRCHTGGVFQGTSRQCAACHSKAGLVRATSLPPDHVRTTTQCQDCHLETTWTPVWRVDHFQLQGACSTCHNGSTATGKPPLHIASGNNCEDCHSTFAWSPADFDHDSTTANCVSCHIVGGPAEGKGPTHINTTNVCEDCHRPDTPWDPPFRVDHMQVIGACSTCHLDDKGPSHPEPSGNNCDDCHNTTDWRQAQFDHDNISSGCSNCHLADKQPTHITTTNFCEDCHRPTSPWDPAFRVDHMQVIGACSTCHLADKGPLHPEPSGENCDDCHNTTNWGDAVFDHTNISSGCSSCHLTDKQPTHITTTNVCEDCHRPTAPWDPAFRVDHAQVIGTCTSCHAADKESGHFVTTEDCDVCHITNNWFTLTFRHTSPSYPGDHRQNLACTDCHTNNAQTITYRFPYPQTCAGCHFNDYEPEKDDHNGIGADSNCDNSGCHSVNDNEW